MVILINVGLKVDLDKLHVGCQPDLNDLGFIRFYRKGCIPELIPVLEEEREVCSLVQLLGGRGRADGSLEEFP